MHLKCRLLVSKPLFEPSQFDILQEVIVEVLPAWVESMRIEVGEDHALPIHRSERWHEALMKLPATRRGLGSASLESNAGGVSFFLGHSERTVPIENNYIAVEIVDVESVESRPCDFILAKLFDAFTARLPVRYAHAELPDEFYWSNMEITPECSRAIGVAYHQHLPGLYWLNHFGSEYCEFMGRERVLSAPAYEVWESGQGVSIRLSESPTAWNDPDYHRQKQAVIEYIGKSYFFSRFDRAREYLAPDFFEIVKQRRKSQG
jgi:hypothetical protein